MSGLSHVETSRPRASCDSEFSRLQLQTSEMMTWVVSRTKWSNVCESMWRVPSVIKHAWRLHPDGLPQGNLHSLMLWFLLPDHQNPNHDSFWPLCLLWFQTLSENIPQPTDPHFQSDLEGQMYGMLHLVLSPSPYTVPTPTTAPWMFVQQCWRGQKRMNEAELNLVLQKWIQPNLWSTIGEDQLRGSQLMRYR